MPPSHQARLHVHAFAAGRLAPLGSDLRDLHAGGAYGWDEEAPGTEATSKLCEWPACACLAFAERAEPVRASIPPRLAEE